MVELSGGQVGGLRPPLRHRLTPAQWQRIDVAVAAALFVGGVFKVDLPRASVAAFAAPDAVSVILVGLGTLPFALRRRFPVTVLEVLAAAAATLSGLGRSPLPVAVTLGVTACTVALRGPRRVSVPALVAAEVMLCAGAAVAVGRDVAGAYVTVAVLLTGAGWFAGESERYRRQYDQAVAAEADRQRRAELEGSRLAVREERVRIAREIHDVVAHSLTVMTVQAGVARRVRPQEAGAVLESIETTGRVAQGELRLILGLLREDDQEEPGLAPAPTLNGLPALVEDARAAGAAATATLASTLQGTTLPDMLGPHGATGYVTGSLAGQLDFLGDVSQRLPVIIGVVIAAAFLLLLLSFRSPVLALKAAVLNLFSIGAAYGVIVAVFQWGWGGSLLGISGTVPIESYVPMIMFAIVFGLSMDYEVFLLTRVREAWARTRDNQASVAAGLASTARVITCAALIITCVFLAFLLSTNVVVKMLALGLGVSIIVDATVIRLLVVPATMFLLGKANWWTPRWLTRFPDLLEPIEPATSTSS